MANRKVSLLLRVKTADGKRPYLNPACAANRKIRPLWAIYQGQAAHFPSGTYYLRYKQGRKLVFANVGAELDVALQQLRRKANVLEAKVLGNRVDGAETPACGTSLVEAIQTYLDSKTALSSLKTSNGYGYVLGQFQVVSSKRYLEELTRADMIAFIADQRRRGMGDRTIFNRVGYIDTFLRSVKVAKLLPNAEWPKYTQKAVRAYSADQVMKLLADADSEERTVFSFFLGTGCREREVQFATWRDVNFEDGTFSVCDKPEFGFKPKDAEERIITLADDLLEMLRERHRLDPKGKLIFSNGQGGPEGHFLRRLKTLAFEAGLNCGNCTNKVGQSCREHPVCSQWELHKFRKTFATLHHESGVPARTIQRWLGHSDLETTLVYLEAADSRSATAHNQANKTFGSILRPRPELVA
jgi:integrase